MNGGNGITPTVELATTNGNGFGYPYPVYPMYGNGGYGNNGLFGGDLWGILLIALLFGNGGWGGFGGFGGGFGGLTDGGLLGYAIGNNATKNDLSDSINSLHLSNQIEGVRDDVNDIQNAICSSTASINNNLSNGFYSAEISANNRAVNQMQDTWALSRQLCDCCCENRLATCQTQNIVQNEANATRFADANNTRDIITNATANTQAILDKLCQLELDGKQDRINELERQLTMADLRASQTAQNAFISQGFANEVDALYNRLNSCPVPTTPVYGRTPIFTCNNGCGCNGNFTTSQFI